MPRTFPKVPEVSRSILLIGHRARPYPPFTDKKLVLGSLRSAVLVLFVPPGLALEQCRRR